jgi:nicotinamidase-related amidase
MLLSRDKSQLLIVDVQTKLLPVVSGQQAVLDRCILLVRAARRLGIPITVSEQYPRGLGPTVASLRDAVGDFGAVFEKIEFSCLRNTVLHERLHSLRRKGTSQVVVAGTEAHVCVAQTTIDLATQGFETFVVADAVGSRSETDRKLALLRIGKCGADAVTSEMVVFEWLGQAGTPEFKDLLALVK